MNGKIDLKTTKFDVVTLEYWGVGVPAAATKLNPVAVAIGPKMEIDLTMTSQIVN